MKTQLIIARYHENISWVLDKKNKINDIVLYNKGRPIELSNTKIVSRPNLPIHGREPETYLYHIISNYDQLADYNVFTQGDPIQHSPYFLEIINYLLLNKIYNNYQPLTCMWLENSEVPPMEYIKYSDLRIDKYSLYMETVDDNLLPITYTDYGIMPILYRFRKFHNIKAKQKILPYIEKKLGLEKKIITPYLKFNFGAIFGIKKENILQHPISFYERLYEFSIEHNTHAYILERLWYTIFY